jgi:hypothetical protein
MNWPLPATKSSHIPRRTIAVMRAGRPFFFRLCAGASLAFTLLPAAAAQQSGSDAAPAIGEIVQQLVSRNELRAQQLGSYTSRRHYHVAYHGFPHAAEADMVVDVSFEAPSSKHFEVVSESGSRLLLDHVLRKLLRTEQDSSRDRADSALTPANYNFALVRTETDAGRLTYVLSVEPKAPRSLLYRGTIWVDANDYAVVKVEAQPAKNPSFWIRNTEIHHVYSKTGDFWLAQSNRTETKVRLGGTAVLTIEYGNYRFANAGNSPANVSERAASAPLN